METRRQAFETEVQLVNCDGHEPIFNRVAASFCISVRGFKDTAEGVGAAVIVTQDACCTPTGLHLRIV
ncbi:hypothetical protein T01_15502 [Trichinella spiralis]|uniref:Uncharacterized protein n=1 Tax=Trichinella spiralis TaxID=6334 RepID=A0A0V1B2Q9_TRISP|nr:hypothetical protein T01_15502 [Trichinella spiralis]